MAEVLSRQAGPLLYIKLPQCSAGGPEAPERLGWRRWLRTVVTFVLILGLTLTVPRLKLITLN